MASMIDWPTYLPQLADVGFNIPDTRLISQTDIGPAKVRNRYTYAPISFSGRLFFNYQQAVQFLEFYTATLDHGALSFNWEHPLTDATVEVRFKALSSLDLFKTGHATERIWVLTVELEVLSAS